MVNSKRIGMMENDSFEGKIQKTRNILVVGKSHQ
jgi:hypothetical protein